jgi:phenylacetate-CoA ligase
LIGRFIHRHLLLPAFETGLKRRNTLRYWAELEQTQWLDPATLAQLQLNSLRDLLAHAARNCPYYRNEWRERGLDASKLGSLREFRQWPVIDRDIIRAHRLEMRAESPGLRLITKSTGGSSGVPLQFDLDTSSHERRTAAAHRGYAWAGAGPGTRQLHLWGVPLGGQSFRKASKDRLYGWLYRKRIFSSFDMNRQREEAFVTQLGAMRPEVIVAYTNPLYELARSLEERRVRPFSPKSIVVGAEKLLHFQRELIERVFGAPVFETYGSREFMLIGAECDGYEGLHLTNEHLLVELLDDNGQPAAAGEEGDVVITDFHNYGMPFIRYVTGDRAVAGEGDCSCGRGLPLLKKVTGRRLDVLHSPDGRRIAGEFFPHLLKDFAAIRRFQVVQERIDCVQLRLVAPDLDSQSRREIEASVGTALGPAMRLELLMVEEIPLTPAGKLQVVINRVGNEARLPNAAARAA